MADIILLSAGWHYLVPDWPASGIPEPCPQPIHREKFGALVAGSYASSIVSIVLDMITEGGI